MYTPSNSSPDTLVEKPVIIWKRRDLACGIIRVCVYDIAAGAVSDFTRPWDNLFKSRPSGFRLGKCNAIVIPTCNIAAAGFACERTGLGARTPGPGLTSSLQDPDN